jgi:hypothetical protein
MRQRWAPPRAGFGRTDLLAAMAVFLLCTGIAVPAAYQANAKQDRQQAVNNLKQLGIAAHNAHDVNRQFPPSAGKYAGLEGSLHFHLLPYIEQQHIWKNGDVAASIKDLRDPADRSAPAGGVYKRALGTTSYVGNWLVFKGGPRAPGGAKITQIVDGTSQTIMFAQRYQMCDGTPSAWGYDQLYYWTPMFAYFSLGKFQVHPPQESCNPALAQSILRDGMVCTFCDGSVHFLGNNLSPLTWALVCCPNDGQPIPPDLDWDN